MDAQSLRIVMVGTKDFAVPTLARLLDAGMDVVALVTQPERPQGRRQELVESSIKRLATERGVPVLQPADINARAFVEELSSLAPDLLVTAAYGQILSREVLATARLGGINLHGSLLPAYRGAAPVARAIEHGESETGVTVIQMSARVDAGGMLAEARTLIGPDETAGELEARLAELGAPLVVETLQELAAGTARSIAQDRARVSRAPKLTKESGRIDWARSAREIHNLVRAMQPWPAAFTFWTWADGRPGFRLIVHKTEVVAGAGAPGEVLTAARDELIVAAGDGAVRLLSVQVPGKKAMLAGDFLRGHALAAGGRFGMEPGQ